MSEPALRVEMFPSDLTRFVDFYVAVLRFELVQDRRADAIPYVSVRRGSVRIGASQSWQPIDQAQRSVPTGIEIVIEVDDLKAERAAIVSAGHPVAEDVTSCPWGLPDFRIFDPDGHYVRFTTRPTRRNAPLS